MSLMLIIHMIGASLWIPMKSLKKANDYILFYFGLLLLLFILTSRKDET